MKYWNKNKDVRLRCWVKVLIKSRNVRDHEIKRWCQQQPSNGRFYNYFGSNTWWFENPQDAMIFILKWS